MILMIKAVGYSDNHLFCDKIKTYNDCTYRKCPTDQSIHNNERPTLPKIIAIHVPNHVRQFDIMKFFL